MIQLIQHDDEFFVSSKEIAEKFGKQHKHILESYRRLSNSMQDYDFIGSNFRPIMNDLFPEEFLEVLMTRDGFSILAFSFTGKEALTWKKEFLKAFNQMENVIKTEIPVLRQRIKELESQRQSHLPPKRAHGNKGTVLVPVDVQTLYGTDTQYHRVPRDSKDHSELSFREGELKRFTQLMAGMARKVDALAQEVAHLRRR
jgi:Rha family phage regulatory protein